MTYYGLMLSFILEYVRPASSLPVLYALKLNTIIPLTVFVSSWFSSTQNKIEDVLKSYSAKWLYFFLFLMFISLFTAGMPLFAMDKFKAVLGYVFLFFVIARLADDIGKIKGIFWVLTLSHVFLIVMNPKVVLEPETRTYIKDVTFLGDGNDFSLSICVIFPLTLFLYRDAKTKFIKIISLSSLTILLLAVIGMQSRGATLALAGIFTYYWLKSKHKLLGILILFFVGLVVVLYAAPQYFDRMSTIKNYENEGSAQGRILVWKAAIRMATDHPIVGVGAGYFPTAFGTQYKPFDGLPWLTAHSSYFLALGELGLPGIIFLLAYIIGNFKRLEVLVKDAYKDTREDAMKYQNLLLAVNGSLIGFAIGGAFLSALYYPHIYIIGGFIVAANCIYYRYSNDIDATNKV